MTNDNFKVAATKAEVAGPGPHALCVDDVDVVLVQAQAGARAYGGRCPHRGALLGEGELHGAELVCRNHRWRFDVETGKRTDGAGCLVACDVREENGAILVDIGALKAQAAAPARARVRELSALPGPTRLPLIGSMHLLDLGRAHLQSEQWAEQYGTPFVYGLGSRTAVVFADMDDMLPVLRDRPETFRRLATLAPIFRELGVAGVFTAEGSAWRAQRRLTMEALSHRHLRGFYPTLAQCALRLRARWDAAAARGDVLDIADELKRFTVDVTMLLVFGYDVDTTSKDDDVIQQKLGLVLPTFTRRMFAPVPYWRVVRLPADRAVDRAVRELRVWLRQLLADARTAIANDPARAAKPRNFLEAMLTTLDDRGEPFDDDTILGNAMTMLLAGEDTTAFTLAWCVHQLLDAPHVVARVHDELARVLAGAPVPDDIDRAQQLNYVGAVANETTRVRPVAPILFFEAIVDTVVSGVAIPKGTVLHLLLRPSAMSEQNFGAPTEFRPERWLDEPGKHGAHDVAGHQPFGAGPRVCPGRSLALLEMKVALATLYQSFDVERVGAAADVQEQFAFTMSPENLKVRLHARR